MLRRLTVFLVLLAVLGAGCNSGFRTKERVRADLLSYLQKAGFNTQTLVVEVTQVSFDRNVAHLTVAFRPPGATNIHDSMTMNYTMELRGGHWQVTGRADSQGHGMGQGMAQGGQLPAGHPAVTGPGGSGMPGQGAGQPMQLPEGHPALESMPPATPQGQQLPPGHPKVANPTPTGAPRSKLDWRGGEYNNHKSPQLLAREIPGYSPTGLSG